MLPTGVHCLGKSCFVGVQFFSAEATHHVVPGLRELGLTKKNSVMMNDSANCYSAAAEVLGLTHVRCVKHLWNNSFLQGQVLEKKQTI